MDSDEAWADHYRWYPQHPLVRRERFTLKADRVRSFQSLAGDGDLIDIVPLLAGHGMTLASLRAGMRAGVASQPMTISVPVAEAIIGFLSSGERITLTGPELRRIRLNHPELQSPFPDSLTRADGITGASVHSARCGC